MKYFIITLFLIISISAKGRTTADSLVSYKYYVTHGERLYAVSSKGTLVVWSLTSLQRLYEDSSTTHPYSSVGKDHNGSIYLGTKDGIVYRLNPVQYTLAPYYKLKTPREIYFICFNSKNKLFLLLKDGVYNPESRHAYSDFTNTGISGLGRVRLKPDPRPENMYFTVPAIVFMDDRDRLLMSYCFGEFGCTRNIYDTTTGESSELPEINYIQSFSEDKLGNLYITCGLQHMMNFGEIYKIIPGNTVHKIYDGDYDFAGNKQNYNDRLFIGPGAWNDNEQKIYFSSSQGFYKAGISSDNKLTDVEKVFSPELRYQYEQMAVGVQMAVKQVSFTDDNRLIFRTAVDGIGIYNGKEIIFLP